VAYLQVFSGRRGLAGVAQLIRNLRGFLRVLPRGARHVAKLGRGYGRAGPTTGPLPEVRGIMRVSTASTWCPGRCIA
jgi:hypothetical protein